MPISVLTTFFLSALITLGMVHVTALHFFLYWKYLWLDIPVHLLGGVTVALGVMLMVRVVFPRLNRYIGLGTLLLSVVSIGVLWEVFEYSIGVPVDAEGFVMDTVIDLLMDVCGALVGYGLNEQLKKI